MRTKSIYDSKSPDDGLRILVTRYYPRGVKKDRFDLWLRELSPSAPLLKRYRSGEIDWDAFSEAFRNEMVALPSRADEALSLLLSMERAKRPFTILCYERSEEKCHRLILEELLRERMKGPKGRGWSR